MWFKSDFNTELMLAGQDNTCSVAGMGCVAGDKQIQHCAWTDHVLGDRRVAER